MSDTSGSHAADVPQGDPNEGRPFGSSDAEQETGTVTEQPQPSLQQPYDVPTGAQQYGQPPATGYTPPETDPPGEWAPVQGQGPQQYGQPEHGQASYAQEGFPAPGSRPGGHPTDSGHGQPDPGYGQPLVSGLPEDAAPLRGYEPQAPAYEQQPYAAQSQQPYPGQGYPSSPYAVQAPMSESDQRLWATLTHISTLVVGFVGPLVAYLVLRDRSPFLRQSTTEALNFSITASIAIIASSFLAIVLIGYVLLPVVYIGSLVLCILAAIAANKGEVYRYPLSWRLVS